MLINIIETKISSLIVYTPVDVYDILVCLSRIDALALPISPAIALSMCCETFLQK